MPAVFFVCVLVLVPFVGAQAPAAPGTTVAGVVYDSIGRAPLAGALVQLVSADPAAPFTGSAHSDSLGRYSVANVPPGRYLLGFFHEMLDSLGVEPPLREVRLDGRHPLRADLAIPSPWRLRTTICGAKAASDSGSLVMGVVRDARTGAAVPNVSVAGMWVEYVFTAGRVQHRVPRLVVNSATNGWFAMCNLPGEGTIALEAARGPDSTDLIEVEVPDSRLLRRDLYIGAARVVADSQRSDSPATSRGRRRAGEGRLTGIVLTADGGRPVANAEVSIRDGPETRTNERGEWALVGAPQGTRMLDVRSIGHYPDRRAVDVVTGASPVRVVLSTMKAVLDTVQVMASRLGGQNMIGFHARRRTGQGKYLTPEDIARRQPVVTSDLFRMVPGVRVERNELGETMIQMRGTFAEECSPGVYIDGRYMRELIGDDIDTWVKPDEIAGIEIYVGPGVPPEFNPGLAGGGPTAGDQCGSIVIWTRPRPSGGRPSSWKGRVLKVGGLAAAGLAVRALVGQG